MNFNSAADFFFGLVLRLFDCESPCCWSESAESGDGGFSIACPDTPAASGWILGSPALSSRLSSSCFNLLNSRNFWVFSTLTAYKCKAATCWRQSWHIAFGRLSSVLTWKDKRNIHAAETNRYVGLSI